MTPVDLDLLLEAQFARAHPSSDVEDVRALARLVADIAQACDPALASLDRARRPAKEMG